MVDLACPTPWDSRSGDPGRSGNRISHSRRPLKLTDQRKFVAECFVHYVVRSQNRLASVCINRVRIEVP